MTYTIQKNVTIPPSHAGDRFPFADLGVGDSFMVPKDCAKPCTSASSHAAKKHGHKYTRRTLADGSMRTWRIE